MTRTIYWLDCPECGEDVFVREVNAFMDGEEEVCSECGSRLMVSCDSESEPYVVMFEEETKP